jgi:hypothetical protein
MPAAGPPNASSRPPPRKRPCHCHPQHAPASPGVRPLPREPCLPGSPTDACQLGPAFAFFEHRPFCGGAASPTVRCLHPHSPGARRAACLSTAGKRMCRGAACRLAVGARHAAAAAAGRWHAPGGSGPGATRALCAAIRAHRDETRTRHNGIMKPAAMESGRAGPAPAAAVGAAASKNSAASPPRTHATHCTRHVPPPPPRPPARAAALNKQPKISNPRPRAARLYP